MPQPCTRRCRARAIAAEGPQGRNNNRPGPHPPPASSGDPEIFGGGSAAAAAEQPKSPIKRSPPSLASVSSLRRRGSAGVKLARGHGNDGTPRGPTRARRSAALLFRARPP
ncbi:hypothetical protein MTO96_007593 [Rhipicephalus appendiculatus]